MNSPADADPAGATAPGPHECAFPVQPPEGSVFAPGPCRTCGKTWRQDQAEKQLAAAQAAMAAAWAPAAAPRPAGKGPAASAPDRDLAAVWQAGSLNRFELALAGALICGDCQADAQPRTLADAVDWALSHEHSCPRAPDPGRQDDGRPSGLLAVPQAWLPDIRAALELAAAGLGTRYPDCEPCRTAKTHGDDALCPGHTEEENLAGRCEAALAALPPRDSQQKGTAHG